MALRKILIVVFHVCIYVGEIKSCVFSFINMSLIDTSSGKLPEVRVISTLYTAV